MDKKTLANYLDFANHHQDATPEQVKILCRKVKELGFHSAFVNQCYIELAHEVLEGAAAVGTVISFPLGQDLKDVKILAAIAAGRKGANELDISMNVGLFKAKKYDRVLGEMKTIVESVRNFRRNILVKFIIETGYLTSSEIKKASELVLQSEADFIKTCSGFGPRGATLKDVQLIRETVEDKIKVKVSGGIGDYQKAVDFISVGADRVGTSKAPEIIQGGE